MRLLPIAFGLALLAAPVAFPQDETPPPLVVVDDASVFVDMAVSSALYSAEASAVALERSRNETVRALAESMGGARRSEAERLIEAAGTDGRGTQLRMSPRHEAEVQSLRSAADRMFDDLYIAGQQRAQDEAVTLYQGFAAAGEPGALRDLAQELLPSMLEGQETVRTMAAR